MRIVSLLPSATEILCQLGLERQLVAVTHECDFPPSVKELPKITRTLIPTDASSSEIDRMVKSQVSERQALYTLDQALLAELHPDLIVTQALCDVCAVAEEEVQAAACALGKVPSVINLEPQTLDELLSSILDVARVTGMVMAGERVVESLRGRVEAVALSAKASPSVILLEWLDPPFACGHWMPELVRLAGGRELLGREGERSVQIDWEDVAAADPDVLLIACCGFDISRTLRDLADAERSPLWRSLRAVRRGQVFVCDGSQYFSRPGPRLVDSLELLSQIFHSPESIADSAPFCVRITGSSAV